jgi:5-methylcytosine-specific restriction endonuclease McrA
MDCGWLERRQLPFSELGNTSPESLSGYDRKALMIYEADFRPLVLATIDRLNNTRHRDWWRQYSYYLESEEWRLKSRETIAAAGGICTYCNKAPAVQAHHITYDRVGEELPEDLRAICLDCHREQHPSHKISEEFLRHHRGMTGH